MSPSEPPAKRTVVVIDGQNLFRGAREALGYISPTIARRPCDGRGWQLVPTRFYRGIPRRTDNRLASLLGAVLGAIIW